MLWQRHRGYIAGRGALDAGSAAPVNTALPVISGVTAVAATLTTTDGSWSGLAVITYTYQWKRNGANIGGATANTYLLAIADLAATITVTVTGTNTIGNASATSAGVGPITIAPVTVRSAMLPSGYINASAVARAANVNGVMVNVR